MRICFVTDQVDRHAGWGRVLYSLGSEMEKVGHEMSYCVVEGVPSETTTVVDLHVLSWKKLFMLPRSIRALRSHFREVDVIHVFDVVPYSIISMLANIGLRKPLMVNAFGTYSLFDPGHWVKNKVIAWVYNHATSVVIVSDFVRRHIERYGFRLRAHTVIPVGVDTDYFKPEKQLAPFAGISGRYILSVGGLKERKGYHITIQAFAKVAKKKPDLQLVIVGKDFHDSYRKRLQELVKKEGVEQRVNFLSGLSDQDLRALYAHADLFTLCPITTEHALEGFGMVFIEASACGIPVIGALDTGAEAAIKDGETGLLVQGTPEAMAEAVERILEDPALQELMREKGPKHAQQFSWTKIAQMYLDVYREIA